MGTATILGTEYPTVVMPDGKEWMAENLAYKATGIGRWWQNAGSNFIGYGAYYGIKGQTGEIDAINALLTGGWHVPTAVEANALVSAVLADKGTQLAASRAIRENNILYWDPLEGATDTYGFHSRATGRSYGGNWEFA